MSHFALVPNIVNGLGTVENVLVITQEEIDTGLFGDPSAYYQTSYNTRGGIYYEPNSWIPAPDQSKALRANYAQMGGTFDTINNVFYAPRPENQFGPFYSWTVFAPAWTWTPPVPMPQDGRNYIWNDPIQEWVLEPSV